MYINKVLKIFLFLASSCSFANDQCYKKIKIGVSTFESVKNICGMPNNSKDPAFATKIRTATYENFSIINSHGGTQVESLQVFDPMYKDEYGVKVRDSRDSVYKVHDIAADQQCSATNKSFFCNSLKHVGLKRLEKKKISYYFSLDVVTIIEHW